MDSRADLWRVLADPPRSHSPTAIWWWSGEPLRRDRLRWQLERLVDGGVQNLVILNLAPSGPLFGSDADDPPFFSEPWWELLDGVCEDALELGAYLWFYDQLGFSGADLQARLVQRDPSYAGQWLGPSGEVTTRGFDYLSAAACEVLIDTVHGEFERRLGHRFGSVIAGSFQDELPALPTWSEDFADQFVVRRGYELLTDALWGAGDPAMLRDYHRTRAELAEEAFFRPLAAWHDKHGLLHGCDQQDPARAGQPVEGVQLYADYLRTHRWFGAPGSDHHGDARVHSSLAHLYGRSRTWIEAFHSTGWGGTMEETFDWLLPWLRAGATLYNPHAVYYSTKAGWWEWAPPATDWRQPYWRHHRVFADAVTRLCAALSLGRHVCDVAVVFPTDTVQAGTSLDTVGPDAQRAQRVYRELVGDLAWFHTVPGALDRLAVDADVIDDDSLQRATVDGGRLAVAGESYRAVVLPATTVLAAETCERLDEFVAAGGLLVAVGALPADPRLRARFDRGEARYVESADELVLDLVPRVQAEVPVLVREVDGTTLVFLTAASPRASEVSVGRPDERGVDLGWLDARYDFDPGRYAGELRIVARDVPPHPVLIDPFTGETRGLAAVQLDGGAIEVVVPFDHGPAALLAFTSSPAPAKPAGTLLLLAELGDEWRAELVPTLDNTWGDLGHAELATVERWELAHRVDGQAEWSSAHATFGPHGLWRRDDADDWQPVVYSTSRGIHKDPIHRDTLGPKGHLPEEFLDFGDTGDAVRFRTVLTVPAGGGMLVIGAAAAKQVRIDGAEFLVDDAGYLATGREPLRAGTYQVELLLVPEEPVRLRAHLSVQSPDADPARPEWLAVGGPGALSTTVTAPSESVLQVVSMGPCLVRVNGAEVGRQGGFDPYAEAEIPRIRRYDVAPLLTGGPDMISLETSGPVLTDGLVVSGAGWSDRNGPARVRRRQHGDPAALHLHRRPHPLPDAGWIEQCDTALPAVLAAPGSAERLERFRLDLPPGATRMELTVHGSLTVLLDGIPADTTPADPTPADAMPTDPTPTEPTPADPAPTHATPTDPTSADPTPAGRVQAEAWSAAESAAGGAVAVELPAGTRRAELLVRTRPGYQAGAALAGPVRFRCGPGRIGLGDWETQGLAGYSGGVRYRTRLTLDAVAPRVLLDLGRVRGTAEAVVNGQPAGVRVCSPYSFDVSAAIRPGENEIEVLVLGTLGPYLDAVSPTHFVFPGQRVTGLFGPVRLLGSTTRRSFIRHK